MNLNHITPLILTFDEQANIQRTLASLAWATQVRIVDSGSGDGTLEVADDCRAATVVHRDFDNHAAQWNFGLSQVTTEWTLALDADYVCGNDLRDELAALEPHDDAYQAGFVYAVQGRPLRGTLYPPRVVLFKTDRFRYLQDGHTQLLDLGGARCGKLHSKVIHDDRKPLSRWLAAQAKYAALEADKLLAANPGELGWKDRLRRGILWAPPLTLFYCLFWKRLLRDAWPGIYYSLQRTYAELLLSLELVDRRLRTQAAATADKAARRATSPASVRNPMAVDDERGARPVKAQR